MPNWLLLFPWFSGKRWADGRKRIAAARVRMTAMRITPGKVVLGRVELEGEPLPDGALVTVLSRESDETFELDLDAEAELLESLAEADRGELIPAEEVLRKLRNRG